MLNGDVKEGESRVAAATVPAREMKVKIPLAYHVRLHSMKILTGKPISDVVTEALDAYFKGPGAKDGFERR